MERNPAVPEQPATGPAGDVRAWDVVTGKLVWTFHSVPKPGEKGHETWLGDGWKNRTGVNVWGFLTVDAVRGIVYMPFGAPSWDRYGGDRKGDGLFGTSLVAADANTGKLLWYFQVVHHEIWDYDLEAPPILIDIKQGGKTIPAVSIVSKSGEAFFPDRVTGKPIYPIEERPVPYQKTIASFPSTQGGVSWGGASFNPALGLMYVNELDHGQLESIVPTPHRPIAWPIDLHPSPTPDAGKCSRGQLRSKWYIVLHYNFLAGEDRRMESFVLCAKRTSVRQAVYNGRSSFRLD